MELICPAFKWGLWIMADVYVNQGQVVDAYAFPSGEPGGAFGEGAFGLGRFGWGEGKEPVSVTEQASDTYAEVNKI